MSHMQAASQCFTTELVVEPQRECILDPLNGVRRERRKLQNEFLELTERRESNPARGPSCN